MASLKIQFFTRHREAGTQRPPARRRSIFLHLQLPGRWLRAHVLDIGRRDRRAAASPRMSRTPHFSTVRIDTTFVGFPATRPSTCAAQRSNAARRSGSSSLLL
jgi:hypothetical protein